jgi:hypothetical protein
MAGLIMKATMVDGTVLDGTAEEISRALKLLNPSDALIEKTALPVQKGKGAADSAKDKTTYVSVTIARAVLSRRGLSNEQMTILRTLYDVHPDTILATDLGRKISYSRSKFAGLLGAFGRRVSHTPGYERGMSFFDRTWDIEAGCWRYGLPEPVRQAMRLARLI